MAGAWGRERHRTWSAAMAGARGRGQRRQRAACGLETTAPAACATLSGGPGDDGARGVREMRGEDGAGAPQMWSCTCCSCQPNPTQELSTAARQNGPIPVHGPPIPAYSQSTPKRSQKQS